MTSLLLYAISVSYFIYIYIYFIYIFFHYVALAGLFIYVDQAGLGVSCLCLTSAGIAGGHRRVTPDIAVFQFQTNFSKVLYFQCQQGWLIKTVTHPSSH